MRSSVSYMLSHGSGEPIMSHPDYEQHAHHHGCLLVLIRGIGPSKPRSLQKIFERIQRVNNVKITDSNGQVRDIWVRYVRDHPVENNDWGDFQTHRRLLGLITVGKFDTQIELNELCRVHESLKVKYTNTLYDSRSVLFGPTRMKNGTSLDGINNSHEILSDGESVISDNSSNKENNDISSINSSNFAANRSNGGAGGSSNSSGVDDGGCGSSDTSSPYTTKKLEEYFSPPSNFKSRAFFYPEHDHCDNLEANIMEFIGSLFWILESKRLERSREKIDKVSLLLAPFEKKDFVGLDLESRNNRKRCMGRVTKHLADLTLQAGLVAESLNLFHAASETLRAISDSLWLGAANEGLCAASAILLYPNIRHTMSLQRNASLQEGSPQRYGSSSGGGSSLGSGIPLSKGSPSQENLAKHVLTKKTGLIINLDSDTIVTNKSNNSSLSSSSASSTSSVSSMSLTSSSSSTFNASGNHSTATNATDRHDNELTNDKIIYPSNILAPEEITNRYRDAIINYSKYRHAGIIETEAALKAARICIEQNQNLDVAMFLQSVLYINLNMSEQERVQRFETLTELYQRIGYNRKAAFCQRLAAWRHVAQSNPNPDWAQSYRLMLDSFSGHRLSLDPIDVLLSNSGWPCLQIDLLQQLVVAARRLGHSALATRHMTFLLQTMWKHLIPTEQKDMASQLQSLSALCEGSPVPLVLENGTVIPPANLTDLPYCSMLQVKDLPSHLRPHKIAAIKIDSGPFLFTPIHFSSIDRRANKKNDSKISFQWVQHDMCEVTLKLSNPLPVEMQVCDMRLLTTGIVFESMPQTVTLAPTLPTFVTLHGTPLEVGQLEVQGYSTHTLGVKSNCRLKNMLGRQMPPNYLIDVIPALPKLTLQTSLPQTATFSGMPNSDSVITSASLTLYNGEMTECVITITNCSNIPIEYLEGAIHSNMEQGLQSRLFQWSNEEMLKKLPIGPHESADFILKIFGDADFLGPVNVQSIPGGIASPSSLNQHIDTGGGAGGGGPHSLSVGGTSGLTISGHASIPSRVSSPINTPRRSELTSSFRSSHSGHSSLATLSLGVVAGHTPRQLEAQLRLRYSGGEGYQEGYCRQCAISFNLELLPSAQVTNWDVLPAEIPSQFYLVLDVINLTAQEMSLQYTNNKNILIEAKESCRVPVPVERCPLERILAENCSLANQQTDALNSIMSSGNEVDLTERACSEHIADQVNLKWTLTGTETSGIASLKGIALSPTMLDLVTVAPLQWEVFVDNVSVPPQAEINCCIGQCVTLGIQICNLSPSALHQLTLTIQFYQDYQNGIHNYRLETRISMSGPNQMLIPVLNRNEKASHECSVIFFTPGRFKADIQCRSLNLSASSTTVSVTNSATANITQSTGIVIDHHPIIGGTTTNAGLTSESHIWRFIPPVEITVVE